MPPDFRYHAAILDALAGHGLLPLSLTPPQLLRNAVRDLYLHEIRRLRAEFVAGRVPKDSYAGLVIALRKRYWVLSVPLQLWTESGPAEPTDIR